MIGYLKPAAAFGSETACKPRIPPGCQSALTCDKIGSFAIRTPGRPCGPARRTYPKATLSQPHVRVNPKRLVQRPALLARQGEAKRSEHAGRAGAGAPGTARGRRQL